MSIPHIEPRAITLYLPDVTLEMLRGIGATQRLILEEYPELEFIVPGWWERGHTVNLGLGTREVGSVSVPPVGCGQGPVASPGRDVEEEEHDEN